MSRLGERIQQSDWKTEKHVPVIEGPDKVAPDTVFDIKVSVGKEIAHPNTTEHHIRWINVFFQPADAKFTYQIGRYEFDAHGESTDGANKGPVYTQPSVTASLKITKPGTIYAVAYCNIHGLWDSGKEIAIA